MTITNTQFTANELLLTVQSAQEGMTVRLPRDISIAALEKHLRERRDVRNDGPV